MIVDILTYLIVGAIAVFIAFDLYRFLNTWFSSPRMSFELLKANPFGSVVFPLVLIIIWFFIFG